MSHIKYSHPLTSVFTNHKSHVHIKSITHKSPFTGVKQFNKVPLCVAVVNMWLKSSLSPSKCSGECVLSQSSVYVQLSIQVVVGVCVKCAGG